MITHVHEADGKMYECHDGCARGSRDPERTPVLPPRPVPPAARKQSPWAGTLVPLGRVVSTPAPLGRVVSTPAPSADESNDAFVQYELSRLVRNWTACTPADRRIINALALRLRPGVLDGL